MVERKFENKLKIEPITEEEILEQYRKYVGDPNVELPEELKKPWLLTQRTEDAEG